MVSFCWILALAAGAAAAPGSFRGHTVAVEDVKQSLHEMMKAMLDGQGSMAKQLEGIEASIWQSYQSLPKNEAGHIGSRAVRYLVHNYFAKEHGWLIKGLEPHGHQENMSEVHEVNILQDKAPLLVESLLEAHRSDRGLSLTDAVAMIATLERLIVDEASTLLQAAYTLNSFTTDEMLEESEMHEVLTSYLVLFELGKKANLNNKDIHRALKARAASVSHNWPFLVEFEHDALHNYLFERKNKRNPFVPIETFSFGDALQIVETLAGGYGKWQNAECQLMKRELMDIDEEGTGIIPLHRFYSQPEGADYHFTESREYLEKVGALQVTQRGSSYVRIANYMTGPSNCIASSSYYSVCCLNECEVLMNELESKILAPSTSPQRLLGLAANLSSATVDAPRALPTVMEEKLHAIAARHDGEVPLHGRLFAQWMHHAFPHECPYPHIAEDTTVLVPSHWQNGKATVPLTERAELAEAHTPVLVETQNLSWSEEEVVVVRERPTRSHGPVRLLMQFALLLGLLHTILRSYKTMTFAEQGKAGSLELPF